MEARQSSSAHGALWLEQRCPLLLSLLSYAVVTSGEAPPTLPGLSHFKANEL